jgi:hypothetical protein
MAEKLDPHGLVQVLDGCFKILMCVIHYFKGKDVLSQFAQKFHEFKIE